MIDKRIEQYKMYAMLLRAAIVFCAAIYYMRYDEKAPKAKDVL